MAISTDAFNHNISKLVCLNVFIKYFKAWELALFWLLLYWLNVWVISWFRSLILTVYNFIITILVLGQGFRLGVLELGYVLVVQGCH